MNAPQRKVSRLSPALLGLIGACALTGQSYAQSTLYWGGNTSTPTGSIDTNSASSHLNLQGTWDNTTTNWNVSSADSGNYTAWTGNSTNDVTAVFRSSATSNLTANITLGSDVFARNLSFLPVTTGNQLSYAFGGSSGGVNRTVTLVGNGNITILNNTNPGNTLTFRGAGTNGAAILAGTNGFNLRGSQINGTPITNTTPLMVMNSQSTISGVATISGATLAVNGGGGLTGINSFVLQGALSSLSVTGNATYNPFNSSASIVLNGGRFSANTSSGVTTAMTLSGIELNSSSAINTSAGNFASGNVTLNLTNGITRGSNGQGIVIFTNGTNTNGGLNASNGLNITGAGLGSNQSLLTWGVVQGRSLNASGTVDGSASTVRFLATDGSGRLVAATTTAGNASLSSWSSNYTATSDINFDVTPTATPLTGNLSANTTVRSIAMGASANAGNVYVNLGGSTLSTSAIAFVSPSSSVAGNLTIGNGTLTAVGNSGGNVTVIYQKGNSAQAGQALISANVTDNGGEVNLILGGNSFAPNTSGGTSAAGFNVTGTNTYTGKTFINATTTIWGSANAFGSSKEINIGPGSQLAFSGARTLGGGNITQTLAGGGFVALGTANVHGAGNTLTIGANGRIAPGNSGSNETMYFAFSTGKINFSANSTLALDLGAQSASDKISFITVGDFLTGSGNAILDVTTGAGFQYGMVYTVFENVTTDNFTFNTVKLNGQALTASDYTWTDAGNYYTIAFAIPEPSSFAALAGLGVLGYVATRRRRHA